MGEGHALSKGRLREDALLFVLVMELTSQLDRLELKDEAYWNAAQDEMSQSEDKACTRQGKGRLGGGTHCSAWR